MVLNIAIVFVISGTVRAAGISCWWISGKSKHYCHIEKEELFFFCSVFANYIKKVIICASNFGSLKSVSGSHKDVIFFNNNCPFPVINVNFVSLSRLQIIYYDKSDQEQGFTRHAAS